MLENEPSDDANGADAPSANDNRTDDSGPADSTTHDGARRRAASRPPGPPPEVPEQSSDSVPGNAQVPMVTFQAPTVVFRPPEPAGEPAEEPGSSSGPSGSSSGSSGRADDDEDDADDGSGRRRRRRRGGRGRGKSAEADDDADEEAPTAEEKKPAKEKPVKEKAAPKEKPAAKEKAAAKEKPAAKEKAAAKEKPAAKGKGKKGKDPEPAPPEADEDEDGAKDDDEVTATRRRRRRRRSGDTAEPAADDPPDTVVRIREPRADKADKPVSADEVQGLKGSTRLEAKKQRRREGREQGRRRPPVITESEFLARRESVERVMVVRQTGDRTQIGVMEDGVLVEHYVDRESGQSYVGNVYLGKVQNVLPSMEAAFIDIGKGRNAVLYAGEVNFDTAGLEGQPKRIESALKSGQSVLVQVTKDPMGHKGARLTSQVSLPGRYLVYVPEGSMTGISRKLPDKERARLKQILKKVMPEDAGVIVRTAAEGASEEELQRDVNRLAAQWESIHRKAKSASAPEMLYAEPDLTIRVVRDIFNEDFTKLVVAGDGGGITDTVEEYVGYVAPHLSDRVERWGEEETDVFEAYRVDEQIAKALERKVWLPSGGSLVIDRTEAMTVVDVNTGKFTGQGGNLEETVTRNNLEAAEEIVRQLRLRDIGGIIVIDFIDMVLESNRDLVLRRLLECLARDRTKHQVAEVTSLGLVQMTRKRVGQGLLEAFTTPCEECGGRGVHVHSEPVAAASEPRGTQAKMGIEKGVAAKVAKVAAGTRKRRGAADVAEVEDDQDTDVAEEIEVEVAEPEKNGRRRRSRRSRAASSEDGAASEDGQASEESEPAAS